MATRKYQQRLRADAAEETRRRILDAVYERLRVAPTEAVSIDLVARMAGVARSTVYLIFGSRPGLFHALGMDVLQRGGFDQMLRASAHSDPYEALRGGIRGMAAMFAAHRDVLRALHSMAQLDPDAVGGVVQQMERGRAEGAAQRARLLDEQGLLRPEITIERATDLIWTLTSFDAFDLLYTGRSLSVDEVADALVLAVEGSLHERRPSPPVRYRLNEREG